MYWGSVRFFKHLILTTLALMIIVPTCFAIYFGVQNYNNKVSLDAIKANVQKEATVDFMNNKNKLKDTVKDSLSDIKSFEYQNLYPELYAPRKEFNQEAPERPVIYLTFDDGPSQNTLKVLDILKEHNAKATFFVTKSNTENAEEIYKRIIAEGHTIGIHTYTHRYTDIYQSVESFLEDFQLIYNHIYEITGVKVEVFRFPGGSINVYNQSIYQPIIAELLRRGFVYYDWNVASGDAGKTISAAAIQSAVVNGVNKYDKSIVLMHDSSTKHSTIQALPGVIEQFKETHDFKALNSTVPPVVFTYTDNIN